VGLVRLRASTPPAARSTEGPSGQPNASHHPTPLGPAAPPRQCCLPSLAHEDNYGVGLVPLWHTGAVAGQRRGHSQHRYAWLPTASAS
jgi:hypothetical protein